MESPMVAHAIVLVPLGQGHEAIIDAADADFVLSRSWGVMRSPKRRAVYAVGKSVGVRDKLLHRLLLNAPRHLLVDHIDRNGLNNRRSNIRLCTSSQNQFNRESARPGLFKGVYQNRSGFYVRIGHEGKSLYGGTYPTAEEAARAYDRMAVELHGEFARLNFTNDGSRLTAARRRSVVAHQGWSAAGV